MGLISFPTGLGCSQWSPGFPPQSPSLGWEVFYQVPISLRRFHAQRSSRPKKEVIVITWPWSGEFPKRKSRDNNHPKLHLGQFDLHRNTSPSWAPTWSRGSISLRTCLPMHLSPYALVFLRTRLPTHSSPYALVSLRTRLLMMARKDGKEGWRGRTSICLRSSTCRGMQFVIFNCRSTWRGSWAVGWTQSTLLLCVVVSLVISIGQSNWLDDKWSPSVYHQDDQSDWSVGEGPPSVCH